MFTNKIDWILCLLTAIMFFSAGCSAEPATFTASSEDSPTSTALPPTVTPLPPAETPVTLPPSSMLPGKEIVAIEVGFFPQRLLAGEGSIWVPNAGSGTISRINPQTNEVVATIPIGKADPDNDVFVPSRAASGDGYIWAAKNDEDSIVQIDPETNQVIATIPIGVEPFALAVRNGTLWITSRETDSVMRIDANTGEIVATISDVKDPTDIALAEDAVWVVNHRDDAITRIDPQTNQIVALVALDTNVTDSGPPCGSCLSGITINLNGIWVAVGAGGIVKIDAQTNQVVAKIPTKAGTFGIVSDDQGIWFSNWEDQTIFCIDPKTNQIVGAIPLRTLVSFLAIDGDSLWGTTDFSNEQARNKVIRFDIQP
jgi:YVTN family beta-propeller protein